MERYQIVNSIREALGCNPIVAVLGPRQCGKTTLARSIGHYKSPNYFDLEGAPLMGSACFYKIPTQIVSGSYRVAAKD
jgi:hypothetical protein